MTTTTQPPFRFVRAGTAFTGTPRWDVFSTIDGSYLGFCASSTSKRNGTIWLAATAVGLGCGGGHRSRADAARSLEEAHNA